MTLIIAEKPELGRAIAAAIPGSGRTEQSVIYKGEYAVIWAYGHLLTLKESELSGVFAKCPVYAGFGVC